MKKTILDFIFGLSSLIGLIFTVIITLISIQDGNFTNSSKSVIAALAIVNFLLCVLLILQTRRVSFLHLIKSKRSASHFNLKKQLSKKDNTINEICEINHNIHDQFRDRAFELFDNFKKESSERSDTDKDPNILLQNFRRTNEMFHLFLIDNIRNLFEVITGDKCSVCIKMLVQDEFSDDINVRTYMRDTNSYRTRKGSDDKIFEYPYYENTAFKTILSPDNNLSYYASDDLSSEKTYVNLNDNWKKTYNSTLVAPIRLKIGTPAISFSVLGFICIDNKKGRLNNPASINLIASIADSLYNHFIFLNSLFDKLELEINESS